MTLNFEVLVDGEWIETKTAIILADGRLGHTLDDGRSGVAPPPYFRHTEKTISQPAFRGACWDAMAPEDRAAAVARMGYVPQF